MPKRPSFVKRKVSLALSLINGFFILFGIALISLGIVAILNDGNMSEIVGSSLYISGVYMIIFLGLMIAIIASCGFIAAQKENMCFLVAYIAILSLLILLLIIAGIMVLSYRDSLGANAKEMMKNTLKSQYGRYRIITDAWNLTQSTLRCCGVDDNGWDIYKGSWWDQFVNADIYETNSKLPISSPFYKFVPESCCERLIDGLTGWPTETFRDLRRCQTWQYGPPNKVNGPHNDAIYYSGCFESLKSYTNVYAKALGALVFVATLILITNLILSVILWMNTRKIMRKRGERGPQNNLLF